MENQCTQTGRDRSKTAPADHNDGCYRRRKGERPGLLGEPSGRTQGNERLTHAQKKGENEQIHRPVLPERDLMLHRPFLPGNIGICRSTACFALSQLHLKRYNPSNIQPYSTCIRFQRTYFIPVNLCTFSTFSLHFAEKAKGKH